jgi:hypothetical protein
VHVEKEEANAPMRAMAGRKTLLPAAGGVVMQARSEKRSPSLETTFQLMNLGDLKAFPRPGKAPPQRVSPEEVELTRDLLYVLAMTWPDGEVTVRVNNETAEITEVVTPKRPKLSGD